MHSLNHWHSSHLPTFTPLNLTHPHAPSHTPPLPTTHPLTQMSSPHLPPPLQMKRISQMEHLSHRMWNLRTCRMLSKPSPLTQDLGMTHLTGTSSNFQIYRSWLGRQMTCGGKLSRADKVPYTCLTSSPCQFGYKGVWFTDSTLP